MFIATKGQGEGLIPNNREEMKGQIKEERKKRLIQKDLKNE